MDFWLFVITLVYCGEGRSKGISFHSVRMSSTLLTSGAWSRFGTTHSPVTRTIPNTGGSVSALTTGRFSKARHCLPVPPKTATLIYVIGHVVAHDDFSAFVSLEFTIILVSRPILSTFRTRWPRCYRGQRSALQRHHRQRQVIFPHSQSSIWKFIKI